MSPLNNYKIKTPTKFETEILNLAPYFVYTNLAISSVGTTYRAYVNNDTQMVVFVALVVVSYFALEICFRALTRLPKEYHITRRLSLKIVIWLLSSAVLFGFAYQLGTFASLPVAVLVFGVVSASSASMFFVYFIHDDKKLLGLDSNSDDEKMIMINEDNKRVEAVLEKA